MSVNLSKQRKLNNIYSIIGGIADPKTKIVQPDTGLIEPGDLVFFIYERPDNELNCKETKREWKESIKLWINPWLGFDIDYIESWHVGIYFFGKKRKNHNRINLWIMHSGIKMGVFKQQIIPRHFTSEGVKVRKRMEILQFKGINKEQRNKIIDFISSKVGFEYDRERGKYITYAFGLPNIFHKQNQFSCQQLAIAAYGAAGISFPHPYKAFPVFNIGRYLGHPLGHPKDRVDPRYPYLMDHHIYRDSRFVLQAAVFQDPDTNEIILQTENLKKYSWNEALREKHIKRKYLVP